MLPHISRFHFRLFREDFRKPRGRVDLKGRKKDEGGPLHTRELQRKEGQSIPKEHETFEAYAERYNDDAHALSLTRKSLNGKQLLAMSQSGQAAEEAVISGSVRRTGNMAAEISIVSVVYSTFALYSL